MLRAIDPQLALKLPIPIVEEIISFSSLKEKLALRVTCKQFYHSTTNKYFPSFTTTLCGNASGYEDGDFLSAKFDCPLFGLLDSSSENLFVSDFRNNVIRKINLVTRKVTTLCGTPKEISDKDGSGSSYQFENPGGLALDEKNNILFISDILNHIIVGVSLVDGRINMIYGQKCKFGMEDGIGNEATFNNPRGLGFDSISNHLYVADGVNNLIRRIMLDEKRVETLCGNGKRGYRDESFEESEFHDPFDIVFNPSTQELYVSDMWNHVIRVLSLKNKTVRTLWGISQRREQVFDQPKLKFPQGLELDTRSNCLYVCDHNHTIKKISLSKEVRISTLCGIEGKGGSGDGIFSSFNNPVGIANDPHSQYVYVIDSYNNRVREIFDRNKIL